MGNKGEADRLQFAAIGKAVDWVSLAILGYRSLEVDVHGMSVRGPRVEGDEVLLTLRGLAADGTPMVAFISSATLSGAFMTCAGMLKSGKVRWRPDKYAIG
jgi:hypothetical protein